MKVKKDEGLKEKNCLKGDFFSILVEKISFWERGEDHQFFWDNNIIHTFALFVHGLT